MQRSTRFMIDLIVIMVALVVLALVVLPKITQFVTDTRSAADTLSLRVLNEATIAYRVLNGAPEEDTFAGYVTDKARMQLLVDAEFLSEALAPQQNDATFQWNKKEQIWVLVVQGQTAPLTELGSSFTEISSAMMRLELDLKARTGSFGRSWGSDAYTDLGLNPEEWEAPVDHIRYQPGGAQIMLSPEEGYTFFVEDMSGAVRRLPAYYNWSLIGDCTTGTWYYHVIAADTQVDITTLRVVPD